MNTIQNKENFEIPIDKIPIIGPIWKKITNCFSMENMVISLVPLIALFFRGDNSITSTIVLIILFYIFSIIAGFLIQTWACDKKINNNNFIDDIWDKTYTSIKGTWYVPLTFTILIIANYILSLPMFMNIRPITLILTIFIRKTILLSIVIYIITWQNLCAFRSIVC